MSRHRRRRAYRTRARARAQRALYARVELSCERMDWQAFGAALDERIEALRAKGLLYEPISAVALRMEALERRLGDHLAQSILRRGPRA